MIGFQVENEAERKMNGKKFAEGIKNGTIEPTENWGGFHPIENNLSESQEKLLRFATA